MHLSTSARIIDTVSNGSPVFAILAGWKQRNLLWYYSWACLLCDLACLAELHYDLPFVHANIFLVSEFILISAYFVSVLGMPPGWKKAGWWLIAAAAVGFAVCSDPLTPNYVGGAMLYGVYIICCLLALYKVIREIEYVKLERSPLFLFSAGFLLYASASMIFLLFKSVKLTDQEKNMVNIIWSLHNILNIIKNLVIAYIFTIPRSRNAVTD